MSILAPRLLLSDVSAFKCLTAFTSLTTLSVLTAGGELCGSFGSWLAGMGLDAGLLSASALAKMQLLWEKAKEAMQLQAVVEQLKEAELQLAQQEAEDNARHVDILVGAAGVSFHSYQRCVICLRPDLVFCRSPPSVCLLPKPSVRRLTLH